MIPKKLRLDRNIASIKSKERLLLCWVDEAAPVTEEAWRTLIPTLREEGEVVTRAVIADLEDDESDD